MNEEMAMVNNDVIEEGTMVDITIEETEESGNGLLKFLAVTMCAAGAAGAYLYKTRDKRKAKKEDRMVEKLEKEGYVVYRHGESQGKSILTECDQTEDEGEEI